MIACFSSLNFSFYGFSKMYLVFFLLSSRNRKVHMCFSKNKGWFTGERTENLLQGDPRAGCTFLGYVSYTEQEEAQPERSLT